MFKVSILIKLYLDSLPGYLGGFIRPFDQANMRFTALFLEAVSDKLYHGACARFGNTGIALDEE